jgi:hypothetical protein
MSEWSLHVELIRESEKENCEKENCQKERQSDFRKNRKRKRRNVDDWFE